MPCGLGPWNMPQSFSFHRSQLGVQVSHLPLLHLPLPIVLLFTYLGLYNTAASLRVVYAEVSHAFAHVVQLPAGKLPNR